MRAIYGITPGDLAQMSWRHLNTLILALLGRDDSTWARFVAADSTAAPSRDTGWQPPPDTSRIPPTQEEQEALLLRACGL